MCLLFFVRAGNSLNDHSLRCTAFEKVHYILKQLQKPKHTKIYKYVYAVIEIKASVMCSMWYKGRLTDI